MRDFRRGWDWRRVEVEANFKPERAAFTQAAFDTAIAAHEFGQFANNGQAETRSTEFSRCGGIGLCESLEETVDFICGNTVSGILYFDPNAV